MDFRRKEIIFYLLCSGFRWCIKTKSQLDLVFGFQYFLKMDDPRKDDLEEEMSRYIIPIILYEGL